MKGGPMPKKKHGAAVICPKHGPHPLCEHDYEERCATTDLTGEEIERMHAEQHGEVVYDAGRKGHSGATSDAFRDGWERMWGARGTDRAQS